MSYAAALAFQAGRDPEGTAIVHEGRTVTRAALHARTNRLARAYASLGVREGDFVTVALPNCVAHLEASFAAWKLGAVPQPISWRLPEAERAAIVELADPRLVVGVPAGSYGERPCLPADFVPDPELGDEDLPDRTSPSCQALASGGSTGRPKLIVDVLPAECDSTASFYGNEPGTIVLVPGPLYHAGPFINAKMTLLSGGTVVLMSRFDPEETLALIERYRVEWVNLVPTMMHRIWRLPDAVREGFDFSSLRVVMSSGAACPQWLMRAWIEWLGPDRMNEAYGGSERIGGTAITGREWLERPGSVGRPTGNRKIRILGDDGEDLPPGEIGEVYMLPPGGQGSTYRYVGARANQSHGRWESLGDMGYLDAAGYLYLMDRRTDMVVTGGANVYPAEVEGALDSHPRVLSSAVIGLPDEDLGQRLHAIVQTSEPVSDDDLRAHLAELLARHKIPRAFEYVDEPLRDDAGKVRRSALRDARISSAAS